MLGHIAGLTQKLRHQLSPSMGTYGYVPKVNYLFGLLPTSIEPGGVEMDLDSVAHFAGDDDYSPERRKQFNIQIGTLSSALEHAVPEQMFTSAENPGEAVSAVKALQKAAAAGQRIYQITAANQATVLPLLQHDANAMGEIQAAVSAGLEAVTHTNPIAVPGWEGSGYIILDPDTGVGAYKISGGLNGGVLDILDELGFLVSTFSDFQGFLQAAIDSDKPFAEQFKNSPFYKSFDKLGKFLGIASLALVIMDFASSCGTEAAVVFSVLFAMLWGFMTAIPLLAALALGPTAPAFLPVLMFVIQLGISELTKMLRLELLTTRLCRG